MYVYEVGCTTQTEEHLHKLQKYLQPRLKGRARPVKHLHCTVWFHGDFVRLLASLRKTNQDFNYDDAVAAYESSLRQFVVRPEFLAQIQPSELALIGHKNGVLVVELKMNEELSIVHEQCRSIFTDMLSGLGIDTAEYSDAWSWALKSYYPHISLFKDVTNGRPPKLALPRTLTLTGLQLMEYGKSAVPRAVIW